MSDRKESYLALTQSDRPTRPGTALTRVLSYIPHTALVVIENDPDEGSQTLHGAYFVTSQPPEDAILGWITKSYHDMERD